MMKKLYHQLKEYADRWWLAPVLGFLAIIDNWILIIPNDGLLISSVMLQPKRWLWVSFWVTLGAALGGLSVAFVVQTWGTGAIEYISPTFMQGENWQRLNEFFHMYGLWLVFLMCLGPISQQPVIVLAALSNVHWWQIGIVLMVARAIKFIVLAYIASHAPRIIGRLWGVRDEVQEVLDS